MARVTTTDHTQQPRSMNRAIGIIAGRARSAPHLAVGGTIFTVLKLIYAIRSVFGSGIYGPRIIFGADTSVYLNAANAPIWSYKFLAGPGPFGYPLLVKLCASNIRTVIVAQSLISIVAWLFLANTSHRIVTTRIAKVLATFGVLATGLAPPFQVWDVALMTESLSISVGLTVIALALRFAHKPTSRGFALFLAMLAISAFIRDTNALVAGGFGICAFACIPWMRQHRKRLAALTIIGIVSFVAAAGLSARANRSYWPIAETIMLRMVGDDDAETFLYDHGMPNDGTAQTLHSNYGMFGQAFANNKDPFKPLRQWLDEDGRSTFVAYLATHPSYVFIKPLEQRDAIFRPPLGALGPAFGIAPDPLSRNIGGIGYPQLPHVLATWAFIAVLGMLYTLKFAQRKMLPTIYATIASGGIAIPYALAIYQTSALEIGRHSVTLNAQSRITIWIATALTIDTIIRQRKAKQETAMPVPAQE